MVPDPSIDSELADEVTRVKEVSYLEGASGHGVLSLLFLVVAGGLVWTGLRSGGVVALVCAYGVALNGLSIYAWDRLRARFIAVIEDPDDPGAARTLTPHRISGEMKAEILAGLVMLGGFIVFLGAVFLTFRVFTRNTVIVLLVGGLALGNLAALAWKYYTTP